MEKFKEVGLFLICVITILAIAYFTGFLKGFTVSDFQDAYNRISKSLSDGIASTGVSDKLSTASSSGSQNIRVFKDYKAIPIPENVLKGYQTSNSWHNVFGSSQKVIFYIYDNTDKNSRYDQSFYTQINSYYETNKMSRFYNHEPIILYYFEKLNWGNSGPDKMCNSIQECNAYREKASNYSLLNDFLKQCGKTMCVINPRTKQYIILKSRNANDAIKMLNAVKTW